MSSILRKRLPRILASAALVAMLGMATSANAETTLHMAVNNDLKILDPITNTGYETRNHGYMIYDTLFAMDENFEPQPQMIDTWTVSGDSLIYTFTLRDGLNWHDGTPVTAEDCIASIKRWGARDSMGQKLMDFTAELAAVNDKTFTLTLKEPYGLVLQSLGKISSNVPFMMPKRIADTDPSVAITETIGSGPFKFIDAEWVPGSLVVYVKNEDYIPRDEPPSQAAGGKVVMVDRVEWHYMPDPATAVNALIAGEIDYVPEPAFDLVPQLEAADDVTVEIIDPVGSQGMIRLNHLVPPFDNPAMRQAVLEAIQLEDYLQAAIGNEKYYTLCTALFMCGGPYETDAGGDGVLKADPEAARKLLDEAGYDGTPIVIMQPTDDPIISAASLVTAQFLRKAGFEVDVQAMDWSTMASRRQMQEPVAEGGWNIFHTWWVGSDMLDPVVNLGVNTGCVERAWFGWPCNEEIESLRDQFVRESDPAKQKSLAEKIQKLAYENVAYLPFGQWFLPVAHRDSITGIIPSSVPYFMWNVEKH